MIKSIIIDDDPHCINLIEALLKIHCPNVEVLSTCINIEQAVEMIKTHKPNLVFLDIELNGEFGFDLFKHFPATTFQVIFTTSHQEYALRAIKSSCLDFILKPIDPIELIESVKKVNIHKEIDKNIPLLLDNINNNTQKLKRIAISSLTDYKFLEIDDIIGLEGDGKYTTFFTNTNEKIISSENLGVYEKMLDGDVFFRCHKSYIINLKYAQKFSKDDNTVLMSNGMKVAVSTRKKEHLLRLFARA